MPPGIYLRRPPLERFEAKYIPEPNTGCWLWTASLSARHGYGYFWGPNSTRAHCVAYELFVGPIPEELEIDHKCRNKWCVNPEHLEVVTHAENMRRMGLSITHCTNGHALSADNVYLDKFNRRHCKICRKSALAKHRREHREEYNARHRKYKREQREAINGL